MAEAISSGRPSVERLYDASAQLAQVVVDDGDRDLARHLIESGVGAGACADAIRPNNATIPKMPITPTASECLAP
jgi:hypothetical protein